MKTFKFALIAAILAVAMVSYAGEKPQKRSLLVKISIESAMKVPGLTESIKAQVNPDFLKIDQLSYTQMVNHNNITYYVYGTRSAWLSFYVVAYKPPHKWKPPATKTD